MSSAPARQVVEMIAIDRIVIVNPRTRNERGFKEIVDNIAAIGLKRPITVARRGGAGEVSYDLVCGQGRLEAYRALGQSEVPALVVEADTEDCLIASLVENCARRKHLAVDLVQDIGRMRAQGQNVAEVARKTGLSAEYVTGVSRLLEFGEERLLRSVESGAMPLSVAVSIAEAEDLDVQAALGRAYERGMLKGRKLIAARRVVEARRRRGKGLGNRCSEPHTRISADELVRVFEEDSDRKRTMVRRTGLARDRLLFIVEALRRLTRDECFVALLEEEGLATLPENLAVRLAAPGRAAT